MKRFLFAGQSLFLAIFCFTLTIALLNIGGINPLTRFNYDDPVYNHKEEFDPALTKLNSMSRLTDYCDSIFETSSEHQKLNFGKTYTDLVSSVIRKRFYHGYSHYGFQDNFLAVLISKVTMHGYSAVVAPNEILGFPFAACSQQSIVMMELLQSKGLKTRKVSFHGKSSGHFSFEVFYNEGWHFYDTNLEPDQHLLNSYNRPGITWLTANPEVLLKAYHQYPADEMRDVFSVYRIGEVNKFPAPNAIVFQKATNFLSYSAWFFSGLIFLLFRRKYKRYILKPYVRNSRIYYFPPRTGATTAYYPGATASGS